MFNRKNKTVQAKAYALDIDKPEVTEGSVEIPLALYEKHNDGGYMYIVNEIEPNGVKKRAILDKKDWIDTYEEVKKIQKREFWKNQKAELEDIINEKYGGLEG